MQLPTAAPPIIPVVLAAAMAYTKKLF